ncbi:MAG: SusD/RagB family nutrient-binding outer membrane lipoprotein [Flavobacterium sp.]|nr:SusD/RagB family nutrient-binding outer membrane lipoprotein [Flavobacterium sp.]
MKNKFIKSILAVAVLTVASCSDYLDVNDNPNNVLLEQAKPNQLLAAAQAQTYKAISGDTENTSVDISGSSMNNLGNIFMNSWAGNVNSFTGAMANEYGVNMNATFYDNIWDYTYLNISNLNTIANYDDENYDNHKAIAMILKSFYMQYIVDLYGDCPYSEAFLRAKNVTPKYDDDKAIYRALVDQLDAAVAKIDAASATDATVGGEDIMLGGNMTSWKKFANNVKLRLLIRQSGLASETAYIESELDELNANGNGYLEADVTLNPGYNNSTDDQQNPFYAVYGYLSSGAEATNRVFISASKHAADALNGTTTGVVDPRGGRLFTTTGGLVVGIQQGELAAAAPDNNSKIGPAFIPTSVAVGSAMPSYVMTASEIKFLLAEAALNFPAKMGSYDPQTLFNEGVDASFVRMGAGSSAAYLAAIDAVGGFGWSASADKVEAIMTQKWIALMHVHAIESWIDHLRTGYPSIPLPIGNLTGKPKRLMYPTSELTSNTANVPSQSSASAFSTGPFWLP